MAQSIPLDETHLNPVKVSFEGTLLPLATVTLWLAAAPLVAAAPEIVIGQSSGTESSPISVPVTMRSDVAVAALQFDVQFEASMLIAGPARLTATGKFILESHEPTNGIVRVVIYSLDNSTLPEGTFLTLQFTARPLVAGTTPLTPTSLITSSPLGQAITAGKSQGGSVAISAGGGARFTAIALANGQAQLQLTGAEGLVYLIQVSTDLRQWTPLSTVTIPGGGAVRYNDPAPASSRTRFYRALQP